MARCSGKGCNQWRRPQMFRRVGGVIVDDNWFCSAACVEQMAKGRLLESSAPPTGIPTVAPVRLGTLLRHRGVLTSAQLDLGLLMQSQTRLRLGAQLRALNLISAEVLTRALSEQAGVRYLASVDPATVRTAPGGLSRDAVRALGLVPLAEPNMLDVIKVACVAPVPRSALTAFNRLTGWTPEPFLVADDTLEAMQEAYGLDAADRQSGAVAGCIRTTTLSDAAARIAAVAATAGRATMTEARWDPYTWVRLQGAGVTEDVLFARAGAEEGSCLAQPTSH